MKTTAHSVTETPVGQRARTRPRWKHVDVQSTALGAVGNVSVELGQRAYRVVLNCANTDEEFDSTINGSDNGTTT